ncbi:MAG: PAS domain-containing protein [Spirochaetes bacterium]|nr:PAS domain-containing protein [Spirochaetota bacterium]
MNGISFLATVAWMTYLLLGVHALRIDPRSSVNRLFFLVCLAMSLWTFGAVFAFSAETKDAFIFWFNLASLPNIIFYPLTVHFCLALTRLIPLRPVVYAVIYAPAIPLYYRAATGTILFKDFVKAGDYWEFLPDYGSPWLAYIVVYYFTCMMAGAVCFIIWSRRARTKRERRQGRIIAVSMLISIVTVTVDEIFLSKIEGYTTKAVSPLLYLIWMGGIWYAIARHQFLKLTPAMVSECIVANIDESFLLLDNDFTVIRVNQATERLLNSDRKDLCQRHFSEIIEEGSGILDEMERMRDGEFESISCRMHFRVAGGDPLFADTRMKMVRDAHGDIMGVMIIGNEVRGMKCFREHFRVSPREAEVARLLVEGYSRKEIAARMRLSAETVKTHITGVYNKLGVNNRMQMLTFLKEYDLVSERPGEKTVVLL